MSLWYTWDPAYPEREIIPSGSGYTGSSNEEISIAYRTICASYTWSCEPSSAGIFINSWGRLANFLASEVTSDTPAKITVEVTHPEYTGTTHVWNIVIENQTEPIGWVNVLNGTGRQAVTHVEVDQTGNVYLVGNIDGLTDFDPDSDSTAIQTGSDGMFLVKYSPEGDFLWVKTWNRPSGRFGESYDVALDNEGNIFLSTKLDIRGTHPDVANHRWEGEDHTPGLTLSKFNPDGEIVWQRDYPALINGFAIGDSGIAIVGEFSEKLYLDTAPEGDYFLDHAFLTMLDTNGDPVWTKVWGPSHAERVHIDNEGNIYVIGPVGHRPVDYDPGVGVAERPRVLSTYYISKFEPDGFYSWLATTHYGFEDIIVDSEGGVTISGSFDHKFDFDPGSGTFELTANEKDIFVQKLNRDGNFEWAHVLGGSGRSNVSQLCLDSDDNIFVGGLYTGTVDLDPGDGEAVFDLIFDRNVAVVKLDPSGKFQWFRGWSGITWLDREGRGYGFAVDTNGNILFGGTIYSTIDFDPGPGADFYLPHLRTENERHSFNHYYEQVDVFIIKLTPEGNYRQAN